MDGSVRVMALTKVPHRVPLRGGGFAEMPVEWAQGRLLDEEEQGVEHVLLTGVVLLPHVASCGGLLVYHPWVGVEQGHPTILRVARADT